MLARALWTKEEQRLFEEIGHRLTDALASLIAFRSLRESEAQARSGAADRAHVGWWERDFVTGHVFFPTRRAASSACSRSICRNGRALAEPHPSGRPEKSRCGERDALRGGPRYDVEYRVVRPDGTVRVVHSQGDVTRDDAGRPLRQFGVMQDITELRQRRRSCARGRKCSTSRKRRCAVAFDWYIGARESENRWSPDLEAMYGLEPGTFDRTLPRLEEARPSRRLAVGEARDRACARIG